MPKKPKFKVLKDEPIKLPKRPDNDALQQFIAKQKSRLGAKSPPKEKEGGKIKHFSPTPPPPQREEEFALLSDINGSEIFELPLTPQGHLDLQVVRAVSSSRTIGIYTIREGRKRLMVADSSGVILRPSGGWLKVTFFPLVPPRSSRPSTAQNSRSKTPLEPTPPKTPRESREEFPRETQSDSLLNGNYDETQAANEFKAAVRQFRNAGKETPSNHTQVTITDEKEGVLDLSKVEKMFEFGSSLTVLERILLEKSRQSPGLIDQSETRDLDESEPTAEELDMEEESNHFREMLLSKPSHSQTFIKEEETFNTEKQKIEKAQSPQFQKKTATDSDEIWKIPEQWKYKEIENQTKSPIPDDMEPINSCGSDLEMWLPNPNVEFSTDFSEMEFIQNEQFIQNDEFGRESEQESAQQSNQNQQYYHSGDVYHERTTTVYDDGTIVNNIITVETGGGDSDCEDEWVEGDNEWTGYDSDENIDLGNDADFKREAIRIIEEHKRKYEDENNDEYNQRPASRASVVTDTELENDEEMINKMEKMESQFYPEDEYD